jgi:hypothetical protein
LRNAGRATRPSLRRAGCGASVGASVYEHGRNPDGYTPAMCLRVPARGAPAMSGRRVLAAARVRPWAKKAAQLLDMNGLRTED